MDLLEAERYSKISEKAKELFDLMNGDEYSHTVSLIIDENKRKANSYCNDTKTIINMSNSEKGIWNTSIKKFIYSLDCFDIDDVINIDDFKPSKYVSDMYILMCRNYPYNQGQYNKLRPVMVDIIKTQVQKEFINFVNSNN